MQLKHKQDGTISPEEKRLEHALKLRQQLERVQELRQQETQLSGKNGQTELLAQIRNHRLTAENMLADIRNSQNKQNAASQGSFSASVLGLMNGSPIEKQQLEHLKVMREYIRKLEQQSRKKSSTANRYAP